MNVGSRIPRSYRIVYRDESRAGGRLVLTTEIVSVRRPFDARVETRTGPPPGRKVLDVTVNGFGRIRTARALLSVPPGAAPPDRRPDALLADARKDGYALERERRRIDGRICRVYRFAGDATATLARVSHAEKDYADLCIDNAGLVLEEVTFSDGKILLRRLAVEVDENPALADSLFDVKGTPLDVRAGGGTIRALVPGSRTPGSFWELPSPPAGFVHMGRYAVVPPQAALGNPQQRSEIIATVDDIWVDGADVLIVEQGGTLGGGEPFSADRDARDVHVAPLGDGELAYALRSSEVRVKTGPGHFVVVEGTLAPSRLLAIARSLVKVSGGALTFR